MALISEITVKDKLYAFLNNSEVASLIRGRIYKDNRPDNSPLEDVEITVLASTARQNQEFSVNVNVFVHDIKRDAQEWIENTQRIRVLCDSFMSVLEYARYEGLMIALDEQHVNKHLEADLHVITNRVLVKFNSENQ